MAKSGAVAKVVKSGVKMVRKVGKSGERWFKLGKSDKSEKKWGIVGESV